MDPYSLAWIGWILLFLGIEGTALVRGDHGTLSERVWSWFGIAARDTPPDGFTRARRVALLSFMAWLTVHFLTGGGFV